MRVISQDGTIDVPYEQVIIYRFQKDIYFLNKNLTGVEQLVSDMVVAKYSTEEKAEETPYSNIWTCGYGYQFWMSPYEGAYRADGAYGQITTVLPKQGLVVAIQCPESGDFDNIVRPALHEHLLLPLTA